MRGVDRGGDRGRGRQRGLGLFDRSPGGWAAVDEPRTGSPGGLVENVEPRMSVVIVDWLGRGGIAQCSEAWAVAAVGFGEDVTVVTRPSRELAPLAPARTVFSGAGSNSVASHRALVATARHHILSAAPDVVVIQNYVLPLLERPVYDAAKAVGARLVVVVHDHRLHALTAGSRVGLRGLLRLADVAITHSNFVRERVEEHAGCSDTVVMAHPAQVGMIDAARPSFGESLPTGRLAVHFGVVRRRYKGTETVLRLARRGVPDWTFLVAGSGAPLDPAVVTIPGFLEPARLVEVVSRSDCAVLPYRYASQSGAVALAQVLGCVPIASAVGGIPEQITDRVTGLLIPKSAPIDAWTEAIEFLGSDGDRKRIADAGRAIAWERHAMFVTSVGELIR